MHPGNSTSPSGQDESQMDQFAHNDWFIRGIFGRSGRAEFWFFNYRDGLRWDDCPWQIYFPADEDRKARWRAEVKAKVRQIPRPVISHIGGYHHPFGVGPSPTGATKSGSDRALGRSRKKRLSKGGEKR